VTPYAQLGRRAGWLPLPAVFFSTQRSASPRSSPPWGTSRHRSLAGAAPPGRCEVVQFRRRTLPRRSLPMRRLLRPLRRASPRPARWPASAAVVQARGRQAQHGDGGSPHPWPVRGFLLCSSGSLRSTPSKASAQRGSSSHGRASSTVSARMPPPGRTRGSQMPGVGFSVPAPTTDAGAGPRSRTGCGPPG
jgi:hypothetical protein